MKDECWGFIYRFPVLQLPIALIEIDYLFSISGLYKLKKRNKLEREIESYWPDVIGNYISCEFLEVKEGKTWLYCILWSLEVSEESKVVLWFPHRDDEMVRLQRRNGSDLSRKMKPSSHHHVRFTVQVLMNYLCFIIEYLWRSEVVQLQSVRQSSPLLVFCVFHTPSSLLHF